MTFTLPRWVRVVLRLLLGFIGGYHFSVGVATLLGVGLALAFGGVRMDAYFTAGISFSLFYCCALLWAFSERRLWLVAAVLIAGAALTFMLAKLLEPIIQLPS